MASRPAYCWINTKVGLETTRESDTPSPSAIPRTKCVLPAPSGPMRPTTSSGSEKIPSDRPTWCVSSGLCESSSSSRLEVVIALRFDRLAVPRLLLEQEIVPGRGLADVSDWDFEWALGQEPPRLGLGKRHEQLEVLAVVQRVL